MSIFSGTGMQLIEPPIENQSRSCKLPWLVLIIIPFVLIGKALGAPDPQVKNTAYHMDVLKAADPQTTAQADWQKNANARTPCATPRVLPNRWEWVLRNRWEVELLHSDLAKSINRTQQSCGAQLQSKLPNSGMGSNIHVLGAKLLEANERNKSLVETGFKWVDDSVCKLKPTSIGCYGAPMHVCPTIDASAPIAGMNRLAGTNINYDTANFTNKQLNEVAAQVARARKAATEYMFRTLNPDFLKLCEAAALEMFGPQGAPPDLISMHMRWGDKGREMSLVSETVYKDMVDKLVEKHSIKNVTVLITTEDTKALAAFKKVADPAWTVLTYDKALSPRHGSKGGRIFEESGRHGLPSMISLMLSLEARYYVLTLMSNWSRLINELRIVRVDQECCGCTDMIDVPGQTTKNAPSKVRKHPHQFYQHWML